MRSETVIIDTNLWISFLISNNFNDLDNHLVNKRITLVFSIELIEEFITVANRPKFAKYFNKRQVNRLLDVFDSYGSLVEVSSNLVICRDPKDNFLLNLANDSKADYLVSGDRDLLEIKEIGNTKITTFHSFIEGL